MQLDDLVDPARVHDELALGDAGADGGLHAGVLALGRRRQRGEEVRQHAQEEGHVLRDELGEVHVAQRAVQERLLVGAEVLALGRAGGAQDGEDVAQAEVVVLLLGELLLRELVADEELARERVELRVAHGAQLDLHDDLAVGHHHGHAAELRLEVLGQLLAARVARVHRDEVADRRVAVDGLAVGELEHLGAHLDGHEHGAHLLRDDGKHGERDAVELVAERGREGGGRGGVRVSSHPRHRTHDAQPSRPAPPAPLTSSPRAPTCTAP